MKPYKKLIACLCVYFTLALSYNIVKANKANEIGEATRVEKYISILYDQLDFTCYDRLSYVVFKEAVHGYLNLRNAGKISNSKDVLTICDFNQPSTINRLWVIDLASRKVLYNTYVAHGQGTGDDCAVTFSNTMNSHQSSLGFYVTTDTYMGEHGLSLHLQGMDQGFNDAAFVREIVMHGARYVSDNYICENKRLGRSWGCPAIPEYLVEPIINTIKEGTCLFIYYPDSKYMKDSYWLNKRIMSLPDYQLYNLMGPMEITKPRFRTIQYIHNGVLDSEKRVPITPTP